MVFFSTACNAVTFCATDGAELTGLVVLGEVFLKKFLVASKVLAYHLDEGAFLSMLLNVVVMDRLNTSTCSVFTLNRKLRERALQHRVCFNSRKRFITAIRAHNLSLILAKIDVIVSACLAEAAPASVALNRLLQHVEADAAVQVVRNLFLNVFCKLTLEDSVSALDSL